MQSIRCSCAVKRVITLLLLMSVCSGAAIKGHGAQANSTSSHKISPDLRQLLRNTPAASRVTAIIQTNVVWSHTLDNLLQGLGGNITRQFRNFNTRVVHLPARAVEAMAARNDVRYISLDREIRTSGHLSTTTGTEAIRVQTIILPLGITTTTVLDGTGIGIAVLDSGIDTNHRSFRNGLGLSRVVVNHDFTGEGRTDDPYGHGTHVASAAAGNGQISNNTYVGIAPNANILNLRVLNSQGTGTVSSLLAALDFVMSNRTIYNIRVVNMSLGTPAIDSYVDDSLCQAVRQLVDAGVVVLAAAGNNGKTSTGQKIYGQIHSPGNEPSAITVGATNTFGTDRRNDDAVASYSSRGPTRSYWTDAVGIRHYDNLVKPDIAAPGNKVIWAEALNNHIVTTNPDLDAGVSLVNSEKMMYLSGTSMATPVAAGAAALLLQANPRLTPSLVKMILMYTAQPLAAYNMFEQGAGQINIEGAVRLARMVRTDLTPLTPLDNPLLTTPTPPVPQTTIAGDTFYWSQGGILNHTYVTGTELITKYQKVYGMGSLLNDGVVEGYAGVVVNELMMTSDLMIGGYIPVSNGAPFGTGGAVFLNTNMLLGDGQMVDDGIMIGDGHLVGDGHLIGDGIMIGDAVIQAQSAMINGDDTSCMR